MSEEYHLNTKKLVTPQPMRDNISILLCGCGSFNPPTIAHLRMFEISRDYLRSCGFDVIGGYISPVHSGYGKPELASGEDRYQMCSKAVEDSTWITCDDWEIRQPQYTKTRKVLEHFGDEMKKKFPNHKVRPMLLCGADLLMTFTKEGLWDPIDVVTILDDFGVVAVQRGGDFPHQFVFQHDLLFAHRKYIKVIPRLIGSDVSSTKVRQLIKRSFSTKYILHDKVIEHIKEYKLYDYTGKVVTGC